MNKTDITYEIWQFMEDMMRYLEYKHGEDDELYSTIISDYVNDWKKKLKEDI